MSWDVRGPRAPRQHRRAWEPACQRSPPPRLAHRSLPCGPGLSLCPLVFPPCSFTQSAWTAISLVWNRVVYVQKRDSAGTSDTHTGQEEGPTELLPPPAGNFRHASLKGLRYWRETRGPNSAGVQVPFLEGAWEPALPARHTAGSRAPVARGVLSRHVVAGDSGRR